MSSKKPDYTGAIQNLLYCFPLYNYVSNENLNILVFGFSDIAENFIDFAFEMAQVGDYRLNITVVSDNSHAKKKYLKSRPEFDKFLMVDGQTVDDSYGSLSFINHSSESLTEDIPGLLQNDENGKYAYLFIGSDDDDLNRETAKVCNEHRELLDSKCVINCVSETDGNESDVNYVRRNDDIKNHEDYKTLKTMAFNCHLVWNYSKLLDMRKLQRQFLKNYNFIACISYVISLKYKMASIGLDFLDADTPDKVDKLINSKTDEDKKIIENMVANEHRRWSVNMICRNFRTAKSLEKYVLGIETKSNGYHPFLVKGTGVKGLDEKWNKDNHKKWDEYTQEEFDSLDDLDKASVLLHKEYAKQAEKIKKENIILQSDIDSIYKLLENFTKAKNAFDKYYICLQEINAGNSVKTTLYEHYYSVLKKELTCLPVQQGKLVTKRINTLAASFNAILESEKYIDYKQFDIDLTCKIPFILTYKSNLHIGIPFDLTNVRPAVNTVAFRTVESALLINPLKITYICEFERGDLNNLINVLEYAVKSMDSHHLRSTINICLLTQFSLSEDELSAVKEVSERISYVETVKNESEFVELSKKRNLRIFEFNRTRSSSILERYEYCCRSNYKYNHDTNAFFTAGCNEIRYVSFAPYLKISDIFEFKSSVDDYSFPDMQKDYKYFWNLYKGGISPEKRWKALCSLLRKHDETNVSKLNNIGANNIKKEYFIEKACLDSIKKLCEQAKAANGAIDCRVELYSNNSYIVTVNAPSGLHGVLSALLCEAYKLYDPNSINIRVYKGKASLYYNSLNTGIIGPDKIKEVTDASKVSFGEIESLLKEIQSKGYIRNLSADVTTGISFSYSTHQVKDVMTLEGRILELYVYYKILETGQFDDVANSVEIHWGNYEAENEIDIIATKGYKVLIIECKAQVALSQDFYNKLSRLNSDYGLNSIPIIIADTLEIKTLSEDNSKKIKIGNRVGIHTVYKKDDILNIGNTLESIVVNEN